jgi:hypothetical protein
MSIPIKQSEADSFKPPYPGWQPYCLVCASMARMEPRDYGWQCLDCHNTIKHDLTHYDLPTISRAPRLKSIGVIGGGELGRATFAGVDLGMVTNLMVIEPAKCADEPLPQITDDNSLRKYARPNHRPSRSAGAALAAMILGSFSTFDDARRTQFNLRPLPTPDEVHSQELKAKARRERRHAKKAAERARKGH